MLWFPFIVEFDKIGDADGLALFPNPDLSYQVPTTPAPKFVTVRLSAASNHNMHPGTLRGSKPEMLLDKPITSGIVADLE